MGIATMEEIDTSAKLYFEKIDHACDRRTELMNDPSQSLFALRLYAQDYLSTGSKANTYALWIGLRMVLCLASLIVASSSLSSAGLWFMVP